MVASNFMPAENSKYGLEHVGPINRNNNTSSKQ